MRSCHVHRTINAGKRHRRGCESANDQQHAERRQRRHAKRRVVVLLLGNPAASDSSSAGRAFCEAKMLQDLLKQLLAGKTLVIAASLTDSPPAPTPASQTQLGPALPPLGKIPADYQPPDVTVRLFPPDYAIYQDISQLPVHAL